MHNFNFDNAPKEFVEEFDVLYSKLSMRQRLFLNSYLDTFNCYTSCVAAGYHQKAGTMILSSPKIKACISVFMRANGITRNYLVKRLLSLLSTDISDMEPVLRGECTLQDLKDKGIDLSGINSVDIRPGNGGSIKRSDAVKTIELIAKLSGMLDPKRDDAGPKDVKLFDKWIDTVDEA